ncbi:hypothetical protein AB2L27_19760 [Kineococcus sp. LSe6-4]|uniref:Uncharacterized protein n=1 Tax=Kineococcus halophytocola TaxID=3234027 RepID=A0ABV4H5Y0_9ACTN
MSSYPTSQDVLDDLGDKVVNALATALDRASADLREYRAWKPGHVAAMTKRGLANYLHDRIMDHVSQLLDDDSSVHVPRTEPTRDITIGLRYRIRIKKHDNVGRVATYPTQGALGFFLQTPTLLGLIGLGETKLCVGYEWDNDLGVMARSVVSLHDGYEDPPVWVVDLPAATPQAGTGVTVPVPPAIGPRAPVIDISPKLGDNREENEDQ